MTENSCILVCNYLTPYCFLKKQAESDFCSLKKVLSTCEKLKTIYFGEKKRHSTRRCSKQNHTTVAYSISYNIATCLQNASQSLIPLKMIHFLQGTSTNTQNMNFMQPNCLSHNAFLWLLMYGNTKK